MKINQYILGASLISLAAILWWLDGIVLTPNLYNLNLNFVVFMLHLIPFLLMNFFLFRESSRLKNFTKVELWTLIGIAFFGGVLGTLSIVKAVFLVHFDGLSVVALLQKLQPIFAIILAYLFLHEKPTKYFLIFALVAIIGSYFLIFGNHLPNIQKNTDYILAMGFAIIAAFSFGVTTILGKLAAKTLPFQTITYYRFWFTALLMFFIVLITGNLSVIGEVTSMNWMYFFIIAFTTGSGAIFLYYYGLVRVSALTATLCELFFPLSTVFFDYFINHKVLSWVQIFASFVIVASIFAIHIKK